MLDNFPIVGIIALEVKNGTLNILSNMEYKEKIILFLIIFMAVGSTIVRAQMETSVPVNSAVLIEDKVKDTLIGKYIKLDSLVASTSLSYEEAYKIVKSEEQQDILLQRLDRIIFELRKINDKL